MLSLQKHAHPNANQSVNLYVVTLHVLLLWGVLLPSLVHRLG
jgi:hypothetical protein